MAEWPIERFEAVSGLSHALHGSKHVLPVAIAALETTFPIVAAPELAVILRARTPANRALDALERLCAIGAMHEHPHVGRPAARRFELDPSPYWVFARALAEEAWPTGSPQPEAAR